MSKQKPKLGIYKSQAYTAARGIVNDSIGRVWYSKKANPKILLENLTSHNIIVPENTKEANVDATGSIPIDCFYKFLSTESIYKEYTLGGQKTLTSPTINIFKIRLAENVFTLEIRNNDPWILTGLDSAPFDFIESLAMTSSQIAAIKLLITNNDLNESSIFCDLGAPTIISNSGQRTYYKKRANIIGSKNGSSKSIQMSIDTGIDVYSLDKNHWISVAYANAAYNLIAGNTWDNQIIPNPVTGTNPFAAYWSNGSTGLKDRLSSIVTQANNLPVINDNKGDRLLYTEIRDYIYMGDIDKVTFEMAFRLPFYIENIRQTPYTNINGRFNNPYYTKFDDWFGFANGLRTLAGYANTKLLSRTGHMQSFTASIQAAPDDLKLYSLLKISRNNNQSFTNRHVPAYMAKVMEDENPKATYVSQHKNVIHFPAIIQSTKTVYKTPDNGETLSDVLTYLESINVISSANNHEIKNYFLTSAINSFKKRLNPGPTNGYYVVKSSASSLFVIKDIRISKRVKGKIVLDSGNFSGWTIGMGYDVGQNGNYNNFISYTEFNIANNTDEAIFREAMYKKREQAAALYESYKTSVINNYVLSYDIAVKNTIPLMKNSFLKQSLDNIGAKEFIMINEANDYYFFNPNTVQYLNEVEKMIFLSQLFNGGANVLTKKSRAKFIVHSFNTHDYRWLKYFTYKTKEDGLAVYPFRKEDLKKIMDSIAVFNHYDIKQISL